jgi:serine/threonine protein kinase
MYCARTLSPAPSLSLVSAPAVTDDEAPVSETKAKGVSSLSLPPVSEAPVSGVSETMPSSQAANEARIVDPSAGRMIAARYRLDRMVGEGSSGEVWEATHMILRRKVALKFVLAADNGEARLLREARVTAEMAHAHLPIVHDVFMDRDTDCWVMVMELVSGESMADRLKQGPMSVSDAAQTLIPALDALSHVHAQGIVHRDLKPEHIQCATGSDVSKVKVLDFGVAKRRNAVVTAENPAITLKGAMVGTPFYMSPEQIFAEEDIDARADIWALGVILYEALAGQRPFAGETYGQVFRAVAMHPVPSLSTVAPNVPEEISALVDRMLSRARSERPASVAEVREILARHA